MPGFERREVEPRVAPVRPAELRLGDQPAQVRVSLRRLREQRHVRPVEQRQLRAGDRLQTERLRLLRERHRAVEAIVIGEGERRKPKLGGRERELLGERGTVEKREGGVAVELDVHKSRNAESGTRNSQAGFCIHHSPVDRSSNNTTLPPPSRITSTYRRTIGVRHHSSSIRHISPIDSIRLPLPASRFTTTGTPRSSRVTSTRCCTLRARSLSALFRVPRSDFRVCSRFKVDQRVASFGEARPRLHLDHVIQVRALEPRSEEHTSELQSLAYLVCRLLLEKNKSGSPSRRATAGLFRI